MLRLLPESRCLVGLAVRTDSYEIGSSRTILWQLAPRTTGIPLGPGATQASLVLNQTNDRRSVCRSKGSCSPCSVHPGLLH